MSAPADPSPSTCDPSLALAMEQARARFEAAWRLGPRPQIESFLADAGEPERSALLRDLLGLELALRRRDGERPALEDFARRFPDHATIVRAAFAVTNEMPRGVATDPHPAADGAELPPQLGRYRILAKLGAGTFGVVYRGHDDELRRDVAIKVPRRRVATREAAEAFVTEARTLAGLDHPGIVPVYDVGRTEDGLCYVVSKFVEGSDLAQRLRQGRLSQAESVEVVARVAEALHHAHRRGLVHRDVKPANILLDAEGRPVVADFGLALHEEAFGTGPTFAGTPAYMSPEQARGEGHRVDARSDVYSAGVIFYELLTGERPFRGDSQDEVLDKITHEEPRPPRQRDEAIPRELDRICLKALAKRASDRYSTALDLAEDLRHWQTGGKSQTAVQVQVTLAPGAAAPPTLPPASTANDSGQELIRIVPKGLRSFDAGDADFFLDLLPGPRDRDGLPEGIRFWKGRMEATDADLTFAVGLLYGPSGCGKSSLVKAGLLPRLAAHVLAVYVEATAEGTEARLLKGLHKHCPDLPSALGLAEALAALRRGRGLSGGRKVLLVLDQFEQWLHAKGREADTELVQALRQCDGVYVQAVVMVRDDFWMAATRFLAELEVGLLQGQNAAAVDLFDQRHARKVLTAFGRAFGALPDGPADLSADQARFVEQTVEGLSQDGKVISVRLALFAEMVKGRAWTPATLRDVGGTAGVGVAFLEETFSAATAPPEHRYHQRAARAVLKALLPEQGTDIKGQMRPQQALRDVAGYGARSADWERLLCMLDSELRLVTPTTPEEQAGDAAPAPEDAGARYYQLTHDYLVPSLREWLTRKQKETRRGRAELLLADRAAVWNVCPENRQLPSLWQWCGIRGLTHKRSWTPPQRKMMRKAGRYHAARGAVLALLIAVVTVTGLTIREQVVEQHKATQAAGLVQSLLNADTAQVPAIIAQMAAYRQWTDALLREENDKAAVNSRHKLHTSLALLPVDSTQVAFLYWRLLDAAPQEVPILRDALLAHKEDLLDKLWVVVATPDKGKESQRLRAAAALARYDPESEKWARGGSLMVKDLVLVNPVFLGQWSEAFRPVKNSFLAPLADIFRDQRPERTGERNLATNLLADFAADNPQILADLLMDADEQQFAVVYPKFKERGEEGLPVLTGEIDKKLPSELPSADEKREKLAKRQANAAVGLLRMGRADQVWPLLKHSPDPRVRSYLFHRLAPLSADAGAIVKRLGEEPDVTRRRALILSLGEFGEDAWKPGEKKVLTQQLQETYRTAADPGLHAAAEWLLRQWQEEAWLTQTDEAWKNDKEARKQRLASVTKELPKDKPRPQWYVNGQGQTMVVIPGPVEFAMGSPPTEAGRYNLEDQHPKRIGRSFAIASKEVTLAQFRKFHEEFLGQEYKDYSKEYSPTPECPVNAVTWYQAAAYCNWLSKQEGIDKDDWCYVPTLAGHYADGMKLAPDWLKRTGYRLPTEAEWEYACRAGAVTSRYYGEAEELLGKYAWYTKHSLDRGMLPGIRGKLGVRGDCLKPNDLGLFDMLGNALEWCQDGYWPYVAGEDKEDIRDKDGIKDRIYRVLRGGSFIIQPRYVRCAYRLTLQPADRVFYVGFRPARTLTP